jgi:hypothetical protein
MTVMLKAAVMLIAGHKAGEGMLLRRAEVENGRSFCIE